MKFSGTVTLQYDTPFSPFTADEQEQAFAWLAENEFDGAELCISDYHNIDVEALKGKLDKYGLGCSTISTGQARALENISLLHSGDGLRKTQERLKQHIDAAALLGCKVTLGLLRGVGSPGMQEHDKRELAHNMEPVIAYAEEKGITVLLEAINRYETTLFNSAKETVDFIRKDLGNPRSICVLWDIFHANIEDRQFEEAIDCLGDKLQHVHMADSNRYLPGYGHIMFEGIIQKLKTMQYKEYLSFECLNLPDLETVRKESGSIIRKFRGLPPG